MCTVSMITDHYMQRWPQPNNFPPSHYPDYWELLRKARLYDEMTKQPDCPAHDKVEWQRELERVMREKYGLEPVGGQLSQQNTATDLGPGRLVG